MKTKKQRGYLHRLIAARYLHPEIFRAGCVLSPRIRHSHRCASENGKPCNCYPDIIVPTPDGTFSIDHDGVCVNVN